MMKGFFYLGLSKTGENGGIQYQLAQVFRVLGGKAAGGNRSPAPAQNIYFLLTCFFDNLFYRCINIFRCIFRVRHKSVIYFSGTAKSCYIQPPYSKTLPGKPADKAVIFIVDVKFVGRISYSVDQEDIPLRSSPFQGHFVKVELNSVTF